jgi:histidine triad (HIT) family protein
METDCIFCKIASGGTDTEFIYQDDEIVVFRDIHPHAPVHLLIVPRRHIRSINDLTAADTTLVARMLLAAKEAARLQGVNASGYKLLFNVERGGGQVVFHLHLHLLAGRKRADDG